MKNLLALIVCLLTVYTASAQWSDNGGTISTTDKVAVGISNINNNFDELVLSRSKSGPVVFKVENTGTAGNSHSAFSMSNTGSGDIRMQWVAQGVGTWYMGIDNSDDSKLKFKWNNASLEGSELTVDRNGNIGVGTDNPQAKLSVNGKMESEEVQVKQDIADYVFKADYDLISLEDLESFIKSNGHLPNVQNEKNVNDNRGLINLGELTVSVLEKVEELTLHVIELNKRIKTLEAENSVLRNN